MNLSVTFELRGKVCLPGFKPLLWLLASEAKLTGWAADSKDAVRLKLEGTDTQIQNFLCDLPNRLYPAYQLHDIAIVERSTKFTTIPGSFPSFKILSPPVQSTVRADFRPCPACLKEIRDPASRRFGYPFSSCQMCGTDYANAIRPGAQRHDTSMCSFPLCKECEHERANPDDSVHFGSEKLCCPACGPRLYLMSPEHSPMLSRYPIRDARITLSGGQIVAVQSLFGGFTLLADALNSNAVRTLYRSKNSPPFLFSVIARNLAAVREIADLSAEQEILFQSHSAPLVVVDLREDAISLFPPELTAASGGRIAIMQPPSATLELLFDFNPPGVDPVSPFVFFAFIHTSAVAGQRHGTAEDLFFSLRASADLFLCHDLRVVSESAPSLGVIRDGKPQIWRRSRGYVPFPILLKHPLRRAVAAFGTDRNSTVAIGYGGKIIPSQPLGNIAAREDASLPFSLLERLAILFDFAPDVVVCDMNEHLHTASAAAEFADKFSIPLITVQTHHAHALSCMAESGIKHALALVFNNGSSGPDGTIWGAEAMDVKLEAYSRLASFSSVRFPCGNHTQARPARLCVGEFLAANAEPSEDLLRKLTVSAEEYELWRAAAQRRDRSFVSNAAGNLIDAVAAALGAIPAFPAFSTQSLILLDRYALRASGTTPDALRRLFSFDAREEDGQLLIDWSPMFRNLAAPASMEYYELPDAALAFHEALSDAAVLMAEFAASHSQTSDIVLSGQTFMSETMHNLTTRKLHEKCFRVFTHRNVPLDETGLCVGQAYHAGISD